MKKGKRVTPYVVETDTPQQKKLMEEVLNQNQNFFHQVSQSWEGGKSVFQILVFTEFEKVFDKEMEKIFPGGKND